MATVNTHHEHHHHHSHKMDSASKFKYQSLKAIERNKTIKKIVWRSLCILAFIMAFLTIAAYTIG